MGRLRAVPSPVIEPFPIDDERSGIGPRVVGADLLDKTAFSRAALIGHDDTVERSLFGPNTAQADMNGHRLSFVLFSRPYRYDPSNWAVTVPGRNRGPLVRGSVRRRRTGYVRGGGSYATPLTRSSSSAKPGDTGPSFSAR